MPRATETTALRRIGMNVKLRRIELGLKQEEVVLATGIARSHLSRIEAGGVNVSVTTLLVLADALDCGVSDLVAKVDDERRS
jgi:transcriptional regulator with XRE-family HTH domain